MRNVTSRVCGPLRSSCVLCPAAGAPYPALLTLEVAGVGYWLADATVWAEPCSLGPPASCRPLRRSCLSGGGAPSSWGRECGCSRVCLHRHEELAARGGAIVFEEISSWNPDPSSSQGSCFSRETGAVQGQLGRHPVELMLPPRRPRGGAPFPAGVLIEEHPNVPGFVWGPQNGLISRSNKLVAVPVMPCSGIG
jgi:hypothetical protein